MEYKILKYPAPILKRKAKQVKDIGEQELKIVRIMIDVMLENGGVGLSANQIGADKRIFVASPYMKREEVLMLINPRILKSEGKVIEKEGCLSIPGIIVNIKRANRVEVEGLNLEGKTMLIKAEGLLARIIQHEIDHLNGKVILNYLPLRERRKIIKELKLRCE